MTPAPTLVPFTPPQALPAGRRVAGFRLLALLGRGRRSAVYLGESATTGERVAVKLATQAPWSPSGAAPDFRFEHARLDQLAHRHVLRAVAHGTSAGEAYLVTELAEGGALKAPDGGADPADILRWLTDATAALAHLHANGWVHRDVKPGNLLLRADGSLALADFGCAAATGETSAVPAGTVIGTPVYAAPEQSRGEAAAPAADLYSLGVVLFEWLTGAPPFPGRTPTELLGQHLLAPVPALPRALAAWQPLVTSLLAKDPLARPADGGQLLARLRREAPLLLSNRT